jgi:hypothetical protein
MTKCYIVHRLFKVSTGIRSSSIKAIQIPYDKNHQIRLNDNANIYIYD